VIFGEAGGGRLLARDAKKGGGVQSDGPIVGERGSAVGRVAEGVHRRGRRGRRVLLSRLVHRATRLAREKAHGMTGVGVLTWDMSVPNAKRRPADAGQEMLTEN